MSESPFTDTDAINELLAWWQDATGGDPEGNVSGADLVDIVRRLLDRVRPTPDPLLTCPECGHPLDAHYGKRSREAYTTPRLCRAPKGATSTCRCRFTVPQLAAADAPIGGGYRALPRMRLVWLSGRRHPHELPVSSAQAVYDLLREDAAGLTKELFWVLFLDGRNRIIDYTDIAVGTLTSTLVHPREVFTAAMHVGAAHVILAHNHPSGDPSPSAEDLALTTRLTQAGELVGIKVLDHIVIGDGCYRSFSEEGRI